MENHCDKMDKKTGIEMNRKDLHEKLVQHLQKQAWIYSAEKEVLDAS
jgi:hypothetical protein